MNRSGGGGGLPNIAPEFIGILYRFYRESFKSSPNGRSPLRSVHYLVQVPSDRFIIHTAGCSRPAATRGRSNPLEPHCESGLSSDLRFSFPSRSPRVLSNTIHSADSLENFPVDGFVCRLCVGNPNDFHVDCSLVLSREAQQNSTTTSRHPIGRTSLERSSRSRNIIPNDRVRF